MSRVISGGTSINNVETVISTDGGGLWSITYDDIDISNPETERLWDAWVSHMQGGVRSFLVPILSLGTAPSPYVGWEGINPSDLTYDDDDFPTYTRFASPYIVAQTVGARELRDNRITINMLQGSAVKSGQKFSIGGRGYIIERVESRPTPTSAVCIISPPLRAPISNGVAVNFEWPVVKCRAVLNQDLMPMMEYGQFSNVSVSFVEVLTDED